MIKVFAGIWLVGLSFAFPSHGFAEFLEIRFSYPLVPTDNTDRIAEPPGVLEFTIIVNPGMSSGATANPLTEQLLREAVDNAEMKAIAIISEQIKTTNTRLEKISSGTNAQTYLDLPDEAKSQIQILNSVYLALTEQARLQAKLAIENRWAKLQSESQQLKSWKMETRIAIGKNLFGVVWGSTKVVIDCTLTAPTISVSAVFLAYDAVKTVESCYELYKALRADRVEGNLGEVAFGHLVEELPFRSPANVGAENGIRPLQKEHGGVIEIGQRLEGCIGHRDRDGVEPSSSDHESLALPIVLTVHLLLRKGLEPLHPRL